MRFISSLIFHFFSNFIAIIAATYFLKDFKISGDYKTLIIVVAIFTLINLFIKPILSLIFKPFIFITFGLASILINALMLYLLDFFSADVTILSTETLIFATLIISLINIIINLSAKSLYRSNS